MAVFQLGRLHDLNRAMAPDSRNQRPLMDYMRNFYFDLDVHHPALRKGVAEVVGVDNLVYGTNFGGAYEHGDLTAGIGLSEVEREKIRSSNAIALLKLSV
jgi:aminocarboxymuconate-semialdehyde decarboxylase